MFAQAFTVLFAIVVVLAIMAWIMRRVDAAEREDMEQERRHDAELTKELREIRHELHGIRRLAFMFVCYTLNPPPPGTTPDDLKAEIERVKAATARIDALANSDEPPTVPV